MMQKKKKTVGAVNATIQCELAHGSSKPRRINCVELHTHIYILHMVHFFPLKHRRNVVHIKYWIKGEYNT